jgi:hypothetical protein
MTGSLELIWTRPLWAWGLLLPLVLLLLARLRPSAARLVTGTLGIWQLLGAQRSATTRGSRPRIPLRTWLAAAALASAALALVGPRLVGEEPSRSWTLVLDHSPSTSLPAPGEDGSATRRLEAALAEALAWLEELAREGDRVTWRSPARGALELDWGERPPPGWLAHPRWAAAEPLWALHDDPGTIWVTDLAPSALPRAAGIAASGARPVPGPIGASGRDRLDWEGGAVLERPGLLGLRKVAMEEAACALPTALRRIYRDWAAARGFECVVGDPPDAALVLRCDAAGGEALACVAGRDGWIAGGRTRGGLHGLAADGPAARTWLEAELEDGTRAILVRAAPGRIRCGWSELDEPGGDTTYFAVSWSRLFDEATLPPEGVVPLAERSLEGPALFQEPAGEAPRIGDELQRREEPVDAWLALAAALLASLSVVLGVTGSRPRRPQAG